MIPPPRNWPLSLFPKSNKERNLFFWAQIKGTNWIRKSRFLSNCCSQSSKNQNQVLFKENAKRKKEISSFLEKNGLCLAWTNHFPKTRWSFYQPLFGEGGAWRHFSLICFLNQSADPSACLSPLHLFPAWYGPGPEIVIPLVGRTKERERGNCLNQWQRPILR